MVVEMIHYRRQFLKGVSGIGIMAIAGCSGNGGQSAEDALKIQDNEMGSRGTITTSTLSIENTGEEQLNPTISVTVGIGPDGLYGEYSEEENVSIDAGETTEVTLDLFDGNELSEVAWNEVQNGYFTLTYYVNDVEKSHQELGEKSSKYVSFKVLYDGSWQGALGTGDGQRSISGQGDSHLPVDNSASIVSGNAQKQDGGTETLTVQILVDGEVVGESSTSAEYGVAQISENI